MFETLFIILIALACIESVTTVYGLLSGKVKEINPFLAWIIKIVGGYGMLSIKLLGTIFVFYGIWLSQKVWLVVGLGAVLLIVCFHNIKILIKVKRRFT